MEDRPKTPMYYEQINDLMKLATKYSLERKGFSWFRVLKNIFSRISFKLKSDSREQLSKRIKEITDDYIPKADKLNLLCPRDQNEFIKTQNLKILFILEELQQELFEAMNEVGLFDYLEKHNYELGGR